MADLPVWAFLLCLIGTSVIGFMIGIAVGESSGRQSAEEYTESLERTYAVNAGFGEYYLDTKTGGTKYRIRCPKCNVSVDHPTEGIREQGYDIV